MIFNAKSKINIQLTYFFIKCLSRYVTALHEPIQLKLFALLQHEQYRKHINLKALIQNSNDAGWQAFMQKCNYVNDLTVDVIEHIEKHGNEITKQTLAGLLDIESVQSQLPSALSAATLDASIKAMRLYKI